MAKPYSHYFFDFLIFFDTISICSGGGIGIRARLKIVSLLGYGFDPRPEHIAHIQKSYTVRINKI